MVTKHIGWFLKPPDMSRGCALQEEAVEAEAEAEEEPKLF